MSTRIACVGGGPGGLLFAALMKQADPDAEVVVFERNRPDDTFGFGVVFSDATLAAIHDADSVLLRGLERYGVHWDAIEVRLKGERVRCAGNGMAAISRPTLLRLLRSRAAEVGAELRFETEIANPAELDGYDLVVAADGANSRFRSRFAGTFEPTVDVATAKFIWFGTNYMFDGLTFVHQDGPHGTFAVHGYPISSEVSTFIVETDERSWRAAGLDEFDVSEPPGTSDLKSKEYLEKLFADQIDGHELLTNNSRWGNFRTWRTRRWRAGNLVLLGDAAHTAHFSVGSGTKMAMEDAVALAGALSSHPELDDALDSYESARRPAVERIQDSARPSLSWWEHFGRYHESFAPKQFAFHFLTRSIGRDKLARRDATFVESVEREWLDRHGAKPADSPLRLGEELSFGWRVVSVRETPDGPVVRADNGEIRLLPTGETTADRPGTFGLWITAPDSESGLPEVFDRLADQVPDGPVLAAIHGGTSLTRTLIAEQARLGHDVPALLVEPDADADRARTLLLSGRADLVGAWA